MIKFRRLFLSVLLLALLISEKTFPQLKAFPGAEGYGKYTSGGRGGKVIEVTNLNDRGPGSLRDAVEQEGPRIIIFRISGLINLENELVINNGDLTIAGQTAPGDGICIKNYQTSVNASNVIIRYLRFRLGDEKKQQADALSIMNSENIIIDHCSLSWGIDEVASFYDNTNSTMQWCIISESLNGSFHSKGEHGYAGIWGGRNVTFHHNLIAHNNSRNPRFNGARTGTTPEEELVDFINNVIYNWGMNSAYGGEKGRINIVANYYKPGPAAKKKLKGRIVEPWDYEGRWFIDKNFVEGFPEITENNWNGGVQGEYSDCPEIKSASPLSQLTVIPESPADAFKNVLKYAGAIYPLRDKVDLRITAEVKEGNVNYGNGIIDSQTQVDGWPEYRTAPPPSDRDHDGMPDEWELKMELDPDDPADNSKISDEGYTFIERYLNELGRFIIDKN